MKEIIILIIIYFISMNHSLSKIKDNKLEMMRFKDSIARFTFLQLSFAFYEFIITKKFNVKSLFMKLMLTHISVASFPIVKEIFYKFNFN